MTVHSESAEHPLPERAGETPGQVGVPEDAGDGGAQGGGGRKGGTLIVVVALGLFFVAAITATILVVTDHHAITKTREAREKELARGPRLSVVTVETSKPEREISLPGEVRGFNQATLYAKVSGYVADIRVDRGDHVKAGDVLVVIESPETRDDVLSALSNREYTRRTAARLNGLAVSGVVSMLDRDNAANAEHQADANLQRARNVYGYLRVLAPFDGVVTARYVDPGALVPAATSATQQAQPIVDVADVDRVRIFVYLGQDAAPFVKAGDNVSMFEDERPAQLVPGTVTRVAGALDPRTRTMQCEIDIDNRVWHLIPGAFLHVRINVAVPPGPVVPDDALVVRDGTPHVAIVEGGKVHYRAVEVGNDDGTSTRILHGLSGGETIGMNVPVEIDEDELVQPTPMKKGVGKGSESATAAGSPTSTPTSEAPPAPTAPTPGRSPKTTPPEPDISPDNGIDAGTAR